MSEPKLPGWETMGVPGDRWYRRTLSEGANGIKIELHPANRPRWRMQVKPPYSAGTAVLHPGIPLLLPRLNVNREGSVEAFVAAANEAIPELLSGCIVEEEEHIARRRKVIEMFHAAKENLTKADSSDNISG